MRNRRSRGAPSARAVRLAAAVAAALAVAAGCGPRGDRAGQFCAAVKSDQPAITAGVQGSTSVGDVVGRFRALERTAPLAIEGDWAKLTDLVEAAAAIQPGDAQAQARLTAAAYEADGSVRNVVGWVRATCGVDLTVPAATPTPAPPTPAPPTSVR